VELFKRHIDDHIRRYSAEHHRIMVLAILLTVFASTASNVGKAFQKEATRGLPRFSIENEKIFEQYRASGMWVRGVSLDLLGGAVQTLAFSLAPVSLLQPISGVGLAGLALYSHFVMKDTLRHDEWVAVGLAGLGTLGLGMTGGAGVTHRVSFIRMVSVLTLAGYGVIVKLNELRLAQTNNKKLAAALYGLQAGGMFGLSASTYRTGFLMSHHRWTWAPFGIICGVAMSSYGFVLQTCGLKDGSAVIVCTCLGVSSMVVGAITGILGLGEPVPTTLIGILTWLWAWSCIIYGIVVLSGATKQVNELLAYGIRKVPAKTWFYLPDGIAIKIKNWQAMALSSESEKGPMSPSERMARGESAH
jgi:hypothetical protein